MKLIKLGILMIIYLHYWACIWHILVTWNEDDWMPPLDYVWVKTDFYDSPIFYRYILSLYHAVLVITGNDIGPRGNDQLFYCTLGVLLGAIINANIFGELAVLLVAMNRK